MCHKTKVKGCVNHFLSFKLLFNPLFGIRASDPLSFNRSLGSLWCMAISGLPTGLVTQWSGARPGPGPYSKMVINQSNYYNQPNHPSVAGLLLCSGHSVQGSKECTCLHLAPLHQLINFYHLNTS